MGTNLIRAMLLASASATIAAAITPTAAHAQEVSYQIDIPAQSMGDALRALGKATKQNIVFNGAAVRGKRSAAVRGRMTVSQALSRMLAGSGLTMWPSAGGFMVQGGNAEAAPARAEVPAMSAQVSVSANASTVIDARTGAALKGALVEIVETGEKTSTGNLGEFRFPGKTGSFNLRISYLGYPEYQQFVDLKDGRATTGILLSDGSATGEIVVIGAVSARAQALNQERAADNVRTVISTDVLGEFEGTTISEALRKVPGVSFQKNFTNGDGTNINIRGLDPDLNAVKFNGIDLPEGSGVGRSASLNNILADSVDSITISKTLLPSQDSAGTGGLVEIETKTPLDRPRRYAQLGIERAVRSKGFGNDTLLTGSISAKFGRDENFGFSAAIQYRQRDISTFLVSRSLYFGNYLPLESDGSLITRDQIDPRLPFPFERGAERVFVGSTTSTLNKISSESLGATLSAEWKPAENISLNFDYQRAETKSDILGSSLSFATGASYEIAPVASLGGEERYAFGYGDVIFPYLRSDLNTTHDQTDVYTFRTKAELGRFRINANFGYTLGRSTPTYATLQGFMPTNLASFGLDSSAIDPVEGRIISPFPSPEGRGFYPLLTSLGDQALQNTDLFNITVYDRGHAAGKNNRYLGEISVVYDTPISFIENIEVGYSLNQTKFSSNEIITASGFGTDSLSSYGLLFDRNNQVNIGLRSGEIPFLQGASISNFFMNLDSFVESGRLTPNSNELDDLASLEFTREREQAAYGQAKLRFGKLTVVAGVRMSNIRVQARNSVEPTLIREDFSPDLEFQRKFRVVADEIAAQTHFLPRATATFRLNEDVLVRAGYYMSVARPRITELSQSNNVTLFLPPLFGPNGDQPALFIVKGNPDLKPAKTHSFDISIEKYSEKVGVLKLGFFYKHINNPLISTTTAGISVLEGVDLPDDPRFDLSYLENINVFLQGFRPENGLKPARIYGMEASIEQRFSKLPGALSGFGVFANYTYSKSSSVYRYQWANSPIIDDLGNIVGRETVDLDIPNQPFTNQSKHSGTASITYSKYGLDGSLSYTYQSASRGAYQPNRLSFDTGAIDSLDGRISYTFRGSWANNLKIYLEGSDLLKGRGSPGQRQFQGAGNIPAYDTFGGYYGGRSFRVGVSKTF